jgi:hypothetical protein
MTNNAPSTPQSDGKLSILHLRPLDLSVDETMREIVNAVGRMGAKRVVIDSLTSAHARSPQCGRLPHRLPRPGWMSGQTPPSNL